MGARTPTLHPTGPHEAVQDGPQELEPLDWRALARDGLGALRGLARLAGEVQAPPTSAAGATGYRLILLIALVASPIACGASLATWGVHENLGAATEARADQRRTEQAIADREREAVRADAEEKRDSAQNERIDKLEADIVVVRQDLMRMQWTMDSIAAAVGAKVPPKARE